MFNFRDADTKLYSFNDKTNLEQWKQGDKNKSLGWVQYRLFSYRAFISNENGFYMVTVIVRSFAGHPQ